MKTTKRYLHAIEEADRSAANILGNLAHSLQAAAPACVYEKTDLEKSIAVVRAKKYTDYNYIELPQAAMFRKKVLV